MHKKWLKLHLFSLQGLVPLPVAALRLDHLDPVVPIASTRVVFQRAPAVIPFHQVGPLSQVVSYAHL